MFQLGSLLEDAAAIYTRMPNNALLSGLLLDCSSY
jgi:hypothetical protein